MSNNILISETDSSIEKALIKLAQTKIELRKNYSEKSKYLGEEFAKFIEKTVHHISHFKTKLDNFSESNLKIEDIEKNHKEYQTEYHKIEKPLKELEKEAISFHDSFKNKSSNILLANINNLENEISKIKNETTALENKYIQYTEEHEKISKSCENILDLAAHYETLENITNQSLERAINLFVPMNQTNIVNKYEIAKFKASMLTNPGPSSNSKKIFYNLSEKKFEIAFPTKQMTLLHQNKNIILIIRNYLYWMIPETSIIQQIDISRDLSNVIHFNADFNTNTLYFFGRQGNTMMLNDCFSFNLNTLSYNILAPVPKNLDHCCSAVRSNQICITGKYSDRIYFYNIVEDTYVYAQRYEIKIEKLVFSNGKRFYLLYGNSIMKLKENNPDNHYCFKFKKGMDFTVLPKDELQSYIVFHGRHFYFILSGRVLRFDYLHYRVKEIQRLV